MTCEDLRHLDAWVRSVTAIHPGLADPWRVTVDPADPAAVTVRVDPVESVRRGHGERSDPVVHLPAGISFGLARQAVADRLPFGHGPSET